MMNQLCWVHKHSCTKNKSLFEKFMPLFICEAEGERDRELMSSTETLGAEPTPPPGAGSCIQVPHDAWVARAGLLEPPLPPREAELGTELGLKLRQHSCVCVCV